MGQRLSKEVGCSVVWRPCCRLSGGHGSGPQDIDEGVESARGGAHGRRDAPVAGSLELVEAGPVRRQVGRLEDLDLHWGGVRIEDERRVAEAGAPAGVHERPAHMSAEPPACQAVELMMVRPTRRQASVRGQTVPGVAGKGVPAAVRTDLAVVTHDVTLSWRPPPPGSRSTLP